MIQFLSAVAKVSKQSPIIIHVLLMIQGCKPAIACLPGTCSSIVFTSVRSTRKMSYTGNGLFNAVTVSILYSCCSGICQFKPANTIVNVQISIVCKEISAAVFIFMVNIYSNTLRFHICIINGCFTVQQFCIQAHTPFTFLAETLADIQVFTKGAFAGEGLFILNKVSITGTFCSGIDNTACSIGFILNTTGT